MLNVVIDVILLALSAAIIFACIKRGFVGSVFKLSKIVVVLLATALFGGFVSDLCADLFVGGWFDGMFSSYFAENAAEGASVESFIESMPTFFRNILPIDSIKDQYSSFSGGAAELAASLGRSVEAALTAAVARIVGYVITFILSFVLFSIVAWLLERFVQLPVLKQVNTVLGLFWGIGYAYLFMSVVVCLIGFFIDESFINTTFVFRFLYGIGLFTHGN